MVPHFIQKISTICGDSGRKDGSTAHFTSRHWYNIQCNLHLEVWFWCRMSQTPKHVLLRLNQQHKHKFYSPWKQPSEDPPESTDPRPRCRDLCSHDGSTSAVGFQQTQLQTKQWDILLKSHSKSTASFIIFSFSFLALQKQLSVAAFWSTTPQVLNCCCIDCLVALSTPESLLSPE